MSPKHNDMPLQHFIYKLLPPSLQPFIQLLRLDRLAGVAFLLIPCLWGLALAREFNLYFIMLFISGALMMRSAGCIYNDLIDRDLDAQVERTSLRPLACGQISPKQAILIMLGLCGASGIILLQFNMLAIYLGLGSLLLVMAYPWMKRITYWPQLFLGFTFNWGALMGYSAGTGRLSWEIMLLYVYGILWTLFYDTIYAHQDKVDDAIIGVKSTALKLGNKTKPALIWLVGMQTLILMLLGWLIDAHYLFYVLNILNSLVGMGILWRLKLDNPMSCLQGFKYSQIIGWVTLIMLLIS